MVEPGGLTAEARGWLWSLVCQGGSPKAVLALTSSPFEPRQQLAHLALAPEPPRLGDRAGKCAPRRGGDVHRLGAHQQRPSQISDYWFHCTFLERPPQGPTSEMPGCIAANRSFQTTERRGSGL